MTRVVVVTGGGKGIGKAVVERFAAAGDRVVAVGRDERALEAAEAAETAVCDVTDEGLVAALFARLGPVDVLVNNAGAATSARSGARRWTTGAPCSTSTPPGRSSAPGRFSAAWSSAGRPHRHRRVDRRPRPDSATRPRTRRRSTPPSGLTRRRRRGGRHRGDRQRRLSRPTCARR